MPEVIDEKPLVPCNGCGRKAGQPDSYAKASQTPLLDGLCVDCQAISHTCDRGAACEHERIVSRTGFGSHRIAKLRLCPHHQALEDEAS